MELGLDPATCADQLGLTLTGSNPEPTPQRNLFFFFLRRRQGNHHDNLDLLNSRHPDLKRDDRNYSIPHI
ncbi:hypothetical protein BJY01DRAFT_251270 [Aspergillus pseudoustus]|uniref:Uncharacterized protein n=1 Tax=Aspergillus pseudoustus TaxID=1810923 RepID=A0ABR4JCG9_9EURO